MNILLVDDDVFEHKLVDTFLLLKFGTNYNLTATSDLDEALDILRNGSIDCVLLDDQMRPFGNAADNVPRIRAVAPNVPLCLISVCTLENGAGAEIAEQVDGYVNKFELKEAIGAGLLDDLAA